MAQQLSDIDDDELVPPRPSARPAVVLTALGVVFGDIGTSPIYTLQTVFDPTDPHPVPLTDANVYGVVSTIFWSVMLIVTLTYITLVMRADHHGEGGIMALITLLRRFGRDRGHRTALALAGIGIFGAALFFGDGMITPAISVLSAVEGIEVVAPEFRDLVVPITAVIIVVLFSVQRHGTAVVGRFFGPVMLAWFAAIGACGVAGIARHPEILRALSPTYALGFLAGNFGVAFFALAAVVLAVTGAEALYADMGHFGRRAITVGWLGFVLPACTLSYLGQGALILGDPRTVDAPFFLLTPSWALVPMVLLATAATVIASQAVITGAFSLTAQAARLGYLPRLRVTHTSAASIGQVYVPLVNVVLLMAVLTLVFAFRSSSALAYAFGMAVTGTITIVTVLFLYYAHERWGAPLWAVLGGGAVLLTVDALFLAANLTKFRHGAWLPLLIAVVVFTVMTTWQHGQRLVTERRAALEGSLHDLVDELGRRDPPLPRVAGSAVYLNRGDTTAPLALRVHVGRNGALHEQVIVLQLQTEPVPRVPDERRVTVDDLGHPDSGIVVVTARYGYMERPDIAAALRRLDASETSAHCEVAEASFFLSHLELVPGGGTPMRRWRARLFVATSHIAGDPTASFDLPWDRTAIIGTRMAV